MAFLFTFIIIIQETLLKKKKGMKNYQVFPSFLDSVRMKLMHLSHIYADELSSLCPPFILCRFRPQWWASSQRWQPCV